MNGVDRTKTNAEVREQNDCVLSPYVLDMADGREQLRSPVEQLIG